jgi:hypothetical protein
MLTKTFRGVGAVLLPFLLIAALGACTSAIEKGASAGKAIASVSPEAHARFLEDAQAARDIAIAGEDAMAEQCFTHIVTYLEDNPAAGNAETLAIKGVMSAYAKGRVVRRAVDGQEGVSEEFWVACGPMLSESRAFIGDAFGDLGLRILSPL